MVHVVWQTYVSGEKKSSVEFMTSPRGRITMQVLGFLKQGLLTAGECDMLFEMQLHVCY